LMMLTMPIIPELLESGASCFGGGGGRDWRSAFDGGWLGSATKAQIPTIVVRAWEGTAAAAAPRVCMTVVGGMHARVPTAGRIGDDMVVAGP
jgi:hypothetical protein